jgi:hypothetical protein
MRLAAEADSRARRRRPGRLMPAFARRFHHPYDSPALGTPQPEAARWRLRERCKRLVRTEADGERLGNGPSQMRGKHPRHATAGK